jgi:hypothetical protein
MQARLTPSNSLPSQDSPTASSSGKGKLLAMLGPDRSVHRCLGLLGALSEAPECNQPWFVRAHVPYICCAGMCLLISR